MGDKPKKGTGLLWPRVTGGEVATLAPNSRQFYSGKERPRSFLHSVNGRAGGGEHTTGGFNVNVFLYFMYLYILQ